MSSSGMTIRRAWILGGLSCPALMLAFTSLSAVYWPDVPLIGTLGRMLESLQPHLGVLCLPVAGGIAVLGGRRTAMVIAASGLLALVLVAERHLSSAAPLVPDEDPVLTVLWFNTLNGNATPIETLIKAIEDSPADVVFLAEARRFRNHLNQLADHFPIQAGCRNTRCEILALARDPDVSLRLHQMEGLRADRLMVAKLTRAETPELTLVATHLLKPWFDGMIEIDAWHLLDELRRVDGPLVLMGDFNAAPWSQRVYRLTRLCDAQPSRRLVSTWPATAGAFGIPIDQILVSGGAGLASLDAWGEGLGSNHRGVIADIALPGPIRSARPESCDPEGYFLR